MVLVPALPETELPGGSETEKILSPTASKYRVDQKKPTKPRRGSRSSPPLMQSHVLHALFCWKRLFANHVKELWAEVAPAQKNKGVSNT